MTDSPNPATAAQRLRLIRIVRGTEWLMRALRVARELDLPDWCIGAGALRNAVWDAVHGYEVASPPRDVDLAYFDPDHLEAERDHALEARLRARDRSLPWEVTNQAGVHLWFEEVFGHPVEPLTSIEAAVATWPETATAVAVSLTADDEIRVLAPLGLDDLLGVVVRRNPARVSVDTYRRRIREKRYAERWPRVRVIPE